MRVTVLCIALGAMVGTSIGGEPLTPEKAVTFALKGGVNPSTQTMDPDPGYDASGVLGYGGGITLGFNLSRFVSLDADFLYVRKGGHYGFSYRESPTSPAVDFDTDILLDYATVSPLLRATFRPHGFSPYILAGAEFGYLLDAQYRWEESTGEAGTDDAKEDMENTDFSLSFGGGINLPTSGSSSFFLEARYYLGLTDITKPIPGESERNQEDKLMNRGTYLFGGFRF